MRGGTADGPSILMPHVQGHCSSPLHCPVHLMVEVLTPPVVASVKEVTETRPTVCGEYEIYVCQKKGTIKEGYRVCLFAC